MSDEKLWILDRIAIANKFLKFEHGLTLEKICEKFDLRETKRSPRNKDKFIGVSTLNSYANAKNYSNGLNEVKAWQILKALERLIEEEYNCVWNNSEENYVPLGEIHSTKHNEKLRSLAGTWEAISWDKESSSNPEGIDYVHVFKIKIDDLDIISCSTRETDFDKGKLYFVSMEKFCLEISNSARKVFFMGDFGSSEKQDIGKLSTLNLAYTDSGRYTIRCGLVFIKRVSQAYYDNIVCDSKPITELNGLKDKLIAIIKDRQIILSYKEIHSG